MNREEAELTADEQTAFNNVVKRFPGTVGPLEPHTPESRRHYEDLLVGQSRLAVLAERSLLEEADAVLAEDAIPHGMEGRLFDGISFSEEAVQAGPAPCGAMGSEASGRRASR